MSQNFADPPAVKKRGIAVILIIIGIIVLLGLLGLVVLGFLAPFVARQVMGKTAHLKTLAVMKDVEVACRHYRVEYDGFPVAPADATLDTEIRSTGDFIQGLLGSNPRQIKFVDLPEGRGGKFGLVESGTVVTLVDLWGEPYYLILDTNEDGKVRNPEGGADMRESMILYSAGPDRDPKTWADNIKSWR